MKEYILCAAIWYKDLQNEITQLLPSNCDSGIVILGYRHGQCIYTLLSLKGLRTVEKAPDGVGKHAFSHDTYLDCYLTIHKDFGLPKVVKGLRGQTFTAKDANGNDFEFKVSYGYPEKERYEDQYYIWVDGAYRFDNGVAIQIENKFEGWSLGKKINENIKIRVRDQKIEEII